MSKNEELLQIMSTQADLMDALIRALSGTQEALLRSDAAALVECTEREEELLRPFHDLEYAREQCVRALAGTEGSMADLLARTDPGDRQPLEELARRMRTLARRIVDLNSQNRLLLRNAQRIMQETLRLITDDHRRKLVDERI